MASGQQGQETERNISTSETTRPNVDPGMINETTGGTDFAQLQGAWKVRLQDKLELKNKASVVAVPGGPTFPDATAHSEESTILGKPTCSEIVLNVGPAVTQLRQTTGVLHPQTLSLAKQILTTDKMASGQQGKETERNISTSETTRPNVDPGMINETTGGTDFAQLQGAWKVRLQDKLKLKNKASVVADPGGPTFPDATAHSEESTILGKPTCSEIVLNVGPAVTQLRQTTGVVLPCITLMSGPNSHVDINEGRWDLQFAQTKTISRYGVLRLSCVDEAVVRAYLQALQAAAERKGMKILEQCLCIKETTDSQIENDMVTLSQQVDLEVLFVFIESKQSAIFSLVKQVGDCKLNKIVECLDLKGLFFLKGWNLNKYATPGVLARLNIKMGGVNYSIHPRCRPYILNRGAILLGADVDHHGGAKGAVEFSVAAVVGCHDHEAAKYHSAIRLQRDRQEIIEEMEEMVADVLCHLYATHGKPKEPQRIVFFRDGVAEHEFEQVKRYEIPAVRRAVEKTAHKFASLVEPKVKITFILAIKGHKTKFFPLNDTNKSEKGRIVPPGTVVNAGKDPADGTEFYLLSHCPEQPASSSHPTRYNVLLDENELQPADIQYLSFYLCHTDGRRNSTNQFPTPCIYADRAARNGRIYLKSLSQNRIRKLAREDLQHEIDGCKNNNFMFFI